MEPRSESMESAGESVDLSNRTHLEFHVVDARSADAVASMQAYFEELNERFPGGFDPGDTLTADAASFDAPHGAFVLARSDGHTLGCGGVHRLDGDTGGGPIGEIKRMWVDPDWRGCGVGKALLAALEAHGKRLGYRTIRLDTNSVLTEAILMYERAGYVATAKYNDNPFAKHWFEKAL